MYKAIAELDNRIGIAEDGTCWNLITDTPKATSLSNPAQPRSGRVELNINGTRKRLAITTLLSQYWPDSPLLVTLATERKADYQAVADKHINRRALQAAARAPKRAESKFRAYKKLVDAELARQATLVIDPPKGSGAVPMKGWEGLYDITPEGRVWRRPKARKSKLLGTSFDRTGAWLIADYDRTSPEQPYRNDWYMVSITNALGTGSVSYSLPRLMYSTFVAPVPADMIITMIDGNAHNLNVENMMLVPNGWISRPISIEHHSSGQVHNFPSQAAASRFLECELSTVVMLRKGEIKHIRGWAITKEYES